MRLSTTAGTVETDGLAETTNFSIKVTGKAFKILLDGLYADKVAAVIRELSTNAYDAHLAIGKGDAPFSVRLPTAFDPTFRVRDYGCSMTHEQTMRLMSTVFDSTKDSSNTQVGAFGLGSKSPFSLVDSFTLNVVKGGEKRAYSAFIGPDGVPSLALLDRWATEEPQGVEFSMCVEQKDVRAFKERAVRILRWFPTPPAVTEGDVPVEMPKAETLASGKGWALLRDGSTGNGTTYAHARQGCVVYPLNASAIPDLSEAHKDMMRAPLLIDFPIGTLDVAASREALSYDPKTCANISARLNLVTKEITEHYAAAIKGAPTLWEAGRKRRELLRDSNLPRSLTSALSATPWRDGAIPASIRMDAVRASLKAAKGIEFTPYYWTCSRIAHSGSTLQFDHKAASDGTFADIFCGDELLSLHFTVAGERPPHEGRRIHEAHKSSHSSLLIVLAKAEDRDAVVEAMGHPPAAGWTRDLPAPNLPKRSGPAPKRGTTKKEEVKARPIVKGQVGAWIAQPETLVPLDGDAFYAVTAHGKVCDIGAGRTWNADFDAFFRGVEHAEALGYLPGGPLYLVSAVYQKRVEAAGRWKRIDDHVLAAAAGDYAGRLFEESEAEAVRDHLRYDNWAILTTSARRFMDASAHLRSGPLHTLRGLVAENGWGSLHIAPRQDKVARAASYLRSAFGFDSHLAVESARDGLEKSDKLQRLKAATEACRVYYPMVSGYSGRTLSRDITDHLVEYIEAMDMLRASKAAASP